LVQLVSSGFFPERKPQTISNSVEKACIMDCSQSLKICGRGR
jgi:hypothetical protein